MTVDTATPQEGDPDFDATTIDYRRGSPPRDPSPLREAAMAVIKNVGCVRMHWGAQRPCAEYSDGRKLCSVCALRAALDAPDALVCPGCGMKMDPGDFHDAHQRAAKSILAAPDALDVETLAQAFEIVVSRTPGVWIDYSGKANKGGVRPSRKAFLLAVAAKYARLRSQLVTDRHVSIGGADQ